MIKGLSPRRSLKRRIGFLTTLFSDLPRMTVVDVGANPVHVPPYAALLAAGGCRVIGFEPQKDAYDALQQNPGENEVYINAAVGKKGPADLNVYSGGGFTSLYELDASALGYLRRFQRKLDQVEKVEVSLTPLDQIADVPPIDLLKIDVQGAELDIIASGHEKLANAVAIIPEMRFYRLYKGEPLLGDLDLELRKQGFVLHKFIDTKQIPLANSQSHRFLPRAVRNQLVDGDAVYIRSLEDPDGWSRDQLFYLALAAATVFDSQDLAVRCLDHLVARGDLARDVPEKYVDLLAPGYFSKDELGHFDAQDIQSHA